MKKIFLLLAMITLAGQAVFADEAFKKASEDLENEKWKQAAEQFTAIVKADEKNMGARLDLGCAYALLGEEDKAIKEFEAVRVSGDADTKPFAAFNLAALYAHKFFKTKDAGSLEASFKFFEEASEASPGFQLAYDYMNHTGTWLGMIKKSQEIIGANYVFTVSATGTTPDTTLFLKKDHMQGAGEQLIYVFDKASVPPLYFYQSPASYLILSSTGIIGNDLAAMEKYINLAFVALEGKPRNEYYDMLRWNAYLGMSILSQQKKALPKAVEYVQKAEQAKPGLELTQNLLLGVYLNSHEYTKAKEVAQKLLKKKPTDEMLKRIAGLELGSPNLKDGWYTASKPKVTFRVPPEWIIVDAKTNPEMSTSLGKEDVVGFFSGLGSTDIQVLVKYFPFSAEIKQRSPQETVAILKEEFAKPDVKEKMKMHGGPEVVKLGDKEFVWSVASDLTGQMATSGYTFVGKTGYYSISSYGSIEQLQARKSALDQMVTSLRIE